MCWSALVLLTEGCDLVCVCVHIKGKDDVSGRKLVGATHTQIMVRKSNERQFSGLEAE